VHAVAAKRVSDPAVLAAIRRDLDAALCLAGVDDSENFIEGRGNDQDQD